MLKKLSQGLLLVCLIMLLPSSTAFATSIVGSGYCGGEGDGSNLTWILDSNGTLIISGTGKMADYTASSVPWYQFRNTSSLKNVVISGGVTSIGDYAFYSCFFLTDIVMPDSLVSIGEHSLSMCEKLTIITIPDSVTNIASYAFNYSTNLKSIELPESITKIEPYTFNYCEGLERISIPNSIVEIGHHAFEGCGSLSKITVPESVTDIGSYAFQYCRKLTEIIIPDSVISIGFGTFYECDSLTNIVFPAGLTEVEPFMFFGCDNLVQVTIPEGVTMIGYDAFHECKSLLSVVLPGSLTHIGSDAFRKCSSLISISIPNSISHIDATLCCECDSMTDIYYGGSKEEWQEMMPISNATIVHQVTIHYNSRDPEFSNPDYDNTSGECIYNIRIFTSEPTFAQKVGESFQVYCVLYNEDGHLMQWTNPSIVVDNSDLVYLSGYSGLEDGFCFSVKGLAEGQTNLTITDSASGVYATIPLSFGNGVVSPHSYRIDQVPNFGVEEWWTDIPTQTNFYNVGGIYVNGFVQSYDSQTNQYVVAFNAYNSTYMNGAVDIYNAEGKWVKSIKIAKSTGAHSIQDTFKDGWNLLVDLWFEKKGLSYTLSSSAEKTFINISVPKGGYFIISNNYAKSPGTCLYNMIDYIVLSANAIWDFVTDTASGDDPKIMALTSKIEDEVFTLSSLTDDLDGELTSYASNALISAGKYSLGEFAEVSVCGFEDLLDSCNIDLDTIVKTELNITESAFKKLTGPFGKTLGLLFTGNEYFDYMAQISEICWSRNNPYITIYATTDEFTEVTMSGVTVTADQDAVDKEAVLQVFKIAYEDAILEAEGIELYDRYEMYNIRFLKDGEESQIKGSVTVKIPLPDWFFGNNCIVLRQEPDGTWTELKSVVGPSFVEFQTDHFSLYAVVEIAEDGTPNNSPSEDSQTAPNNSLSSDVPPDFVILCGFGAIVIVLIVSILWFLNKQKKKSN